MQDSNSKYPPLYKHQEDGVSFLQKSGCLFWSCGTGKSRTVIETFKSWRQRDVAIRLLVICPINLIENAWGEDIKKFSDFSYCNMRHGFKEADIYIVNYEYLLGAAKFSQVAKMVSTGLWACVADECFDGNTKIETSRGLIKIKDVIVGDKIINCNGWDMVKGTSLKKLDSWLKIKYNNKWVKCSLNHPFLTDRGWRTAINLKKGDKLVRTNTAMRIVQEGVSDLSWKKILRDILFCEMENEYSRNKDEITFFGFKNEEIRKSKEVLCRKERFSNKTNRENKKIKSDIRSKCMYEDIKNIKKHEMETNYTRRKWEESSNTTKQAVKTIRENVDCGISRISWEKTIGVSVELQDRHCLSRFNVRNRSRRTISLGNNKEGFGQKEDRKTDFFRVEDIKIYKQRGNGNGTRSTKKNTFYDLEIEGHPSFDINGVVVHNSSRWKNPRGVTTKRCLSLRDKFVRRVAMTATPCPNSPLELFSQINFVKRGILPDKFGQFKDKYFCLTRGRQTIESKGLDRMAMARLFKQGYIFDFRPGMKEQLMKDIAPICMWVKKSEVLDLPDQIDIKRMVDMTDEMEDVYAQMHKDYITQIADENVVAQTALVKSLRLRQITSGFSTADNGATVLLSKNPKLEMLYDIIEEIGNEQVIIWTNYTQERETIHQVLPGSARLDGQTADKDAIIQSFKSGKIKYLIADKRSVSHGLTFTACANQVFFSLDYSSELYIQGRDRTHRIGQTRSCTYYHIMVKDSIDEVMFDVVNNKIENQEAVRRLMSWKKT